MHDCLLRIGQIDQRDQMTKPTKPTTSTSWRKRSEMGKMTNEDVTLLDSSRLPCIGQAKWTNIGRRIGQNENTI